MTAAQYLGPSILACSILFAVSTGLAGDPPVRPNIVLILFDDLGYGDLGCYGQTKFRTPHVDRIAKAGMRFTRGYSGAPVCAPSRCVLMTGLHSGHAFIRDNRQHSPRGEGQYPIPDETVTLPERLHRLGYVCGAFGKWGLGAPATSGEPLKQGINRFFGYNCQAVAHNFYPTSLWDNDQPFPLDNPPFSAHQKFPEGADPADPALFQRYAGKQYAPDLISEQALQFVRDNKSRPFFLFYPTTVPHLALQVPDDSLAEYAGKFPEEPYLGGRGYLPHPTPRAAYAAMIARVDREIGRLLDTLDEQGLTKNTLFLVSSDNGPLYDQLGGTDCDFFDSARGLRGRKGSVYEGGMRVPLIVRWDGRIPADTTRERVVGFEDITPTVLELVGGTVEGAELDGVSFAPTLRGETQPERAFLYREFPSYGGQQMIRMGQWKGVRQGLVPKKGETANTRWQLYDLEKDPTETTDIADRHPEIVQRLAAMAARQHVRSEVFQFPALDGG
jgi:arylsulfatase A